MGFYLKSPEASIDYAVDWGAGYLDGQTIEASNWSVAPEEDGGVEVVAASLLPSRSMAELSGGLPGRVYRVTNRVTLSDGRVDVRTLGLRIEER